MLFKKTKQKNHFSQENGIANNFRYRVLISRQQKTAKFIKNLKQFPNQFQLDDNYSRDPNNCNPNPKELAEILLLIHSHTLGKKKKKSFQRLFAFICSNFVNIFAMDENK